MVGRDRAPGPRPVERTRKKDKNRLYPSPRAGTLLAITVIETYIIRSYQLLVNAVEPLNIRVDVVFYNLSRWSA